MSKKGYFTWFGLIVILGGLGFYLANTNTIGRFVEIASMSVKDSGAMENTETTPTQNTFLMPDYNQKVLEQANQAKAKGMTAEEFAYYEAQRMEYERQKAEYESQKAAYEAAHGKQPESLSEAMDQSISQLAKEFKEKLRQDSIAKSQKNLPASK